MKWIVFPGGAVYTLASDIQRVAELNGYTVPCEPDGTRHPGTDCNQKMRVIFKDAGMRRTFNLNERSVVVVKAEDSPVNGAFLRWANENGLISDYYVRKGALQLYTLEAVNALLSYMLKTKVSYAKDENDEEWHCFIMAITKEQNLEKKKNRPKASLFKK